MHWNTVHNIVDFVTVCSGPVSVVGIATGYGLDGPGIEFRCGARFSAPVQTSPVAHPASCTMGTGSFPGVKSGQGVTLTPHPLLVPWSLMSRATLLLPLWSGRPVQSLSAWKRMHVTFIFFIVFNLVYGINSVKRGQIISRPWCGGSTCLRRLNSSDSARNSETLCDVELWTSRLVACAVLSLGVPVLLRYRHLGPTPASPAVSFPNCIFT
jgi:hypothetical protein